MPCNFVVFVYNRSGKLNGRQGGVRSLFDENTRGKCVGDDTLLAVSGCCHCTCYLLPYKPCYEKGQGDREAGLVPPES